MEKMKPKFKETIPVFFINDEIHIGEEDGVAGVIEDPNGSIKYLISLINGKKFYRRNSTFSSRKVSKHKRK
ncbi:hypothetical protein Q5794_29795 (plasmid) [Priestia megaterium]|uniref:hypothetical protein n=1 Tax=Priestia megaterium TaxID=1404 RepID=UPI0035BE47EE